MHMAQEEDLCRLKSYLEPSLHASGAYPLPPGRVLITNDVAIARISGTYAAVGGLGSCTVLSAALPQVPSAPGSPEWRADVGTRVHAVLRAAVSTGRSHLVLGAWGCGAFGNPPALVAAGFREQLLRPEFSGAFAVVVFAITNPVRLTGDRNFGPFDVVLQRLGGAVVPDQCCALCQEDHCVAPLVRTGCGHVFHGPCLAASRAALDVGSTSFSAAGPTQFGCPVCGTSPGRMDTALRLPQLRPLCAPVAIPVLHCFGCHGTHDDEPLGVTLCGHSFHGSCLATACHLGAPEPAGGRQAVLSRCPACALPLGRCEAALRPDPAEDGPAVILPPVDGVLRPAPEASGTDGPECPICLEPLLDGRPFSDLACPHVFHGHCLDDWLMAQLSNPARTERCGDFARLPVTCPVCRDEVGAFGDSPARPSASAARPAPSGVATLPPPGRFEPHRCSVLCARQTGRLPRARCGVQRLSPRVRVDPGPGPFGRGWRQRGAWA